MSENEPLDPIAAALHGEPCDDCAGINPATIIMEAIVSSVAAALTTVLVFALCSRRMWESARG